MGLVAFLLLELSKRQEWCFPGARFEKSAGPCDQPFGLFNAAEIPSEVVSAAAALTFPFIEFSRLCPL
jgi:hypothetical protein